MTTDIFVDPSIAGPDMWFSTGTVTDGIEQFAASLPDIAGSADPGWNITQWNVPSSQIFDPGSPILGDLADNDALLGAALASWHTGTARAASELVVYGQPGNYTYRLGSTGGSTSDTFLQTTGYVSGTDTFDHQISFDADERVSAASAGNGTAIAFNSFTVNFNAADNPSHNASLPTYELFLQIPLTDFRGEPAPYQTITENNIYQQIYNLSSQSYSAMTGATIDDGSVDYLAFATDSGPLHAIHIDLNQALLRMVRVMATQEAPQDPAMASAYLDMSLWSVGSYYAGVETDGGTDAGSGSLAIDIAHPTLTVDTAQNVSSGTPLADVQTIDANSYADVEDSSVIATLAGTVNAITLAGSLVEKTFTSNGTDTVSTGNGQTVTLHADGGRLTVIGGATGFGTIVIDGPAPVTTSGLLGALTIDSAAGDDLIGGTTSGATLNLGGTDARIDLSGAADATLSGSGFVFAAGTGTVSVQADGGLIDLNDGGAQTVLLDGHSAGITETGTGSQTIIGLATQQGVLRVDGGQGAQTIWTGGMTTTITGSSDPDTAASLTLHSEAGSTNSVQLAGESTAIDDDGGTTVVQGGGDPGENATILGGPGSVVVWGGAGQVTASAGGSDAGTLQVEAGSGSQTIFGGSETVLVLGSHITTGLQTVVNGNDAGDATTIFGGLTRQTIWSGQAQDTIVSSTLAGDASGSIQAFIQGGASSYWGGVETAALDNQGGILDAFLDGGGHVSILAEMTGTTTTTIRGFSSLLDTLTLGGISDPSRIDVSTSGGNTTLSAGGSSLVTLLGISQVTLSHDASGVLVTT